MATIKAIEDRSVHQIQSGQVIVDLQSVVKELVENSLDAGATSIDVTFKNWGLDSIEVKDNGKGISPDDYESVGLKHHTSKLSTYEDLTSLDTFGFRGEAISSLCALSKLHILTARAEDGPLGKKLDFEVSGRLKSASPAAAQKGTTVYVDEIFYNLPVRRRELEKNAKREYSKALSLLYQYGCICTGLRLSVSKQVSKGKKEPQFTTKANTSTKENIVNIFGAKCMIDLIRLDLRLEMAPSIGPSTQGARNWSTQATDKPMEIRVEGHISKPISGQGRSAPDKQMFFVNGRPCKLPQVSKAVNEVYRGFNVSQVPFVLANLIMDTESYDVNVSPDKKTILLHDQTALLESLKSALTELFEQTDYTVPQSTLPQRKLPSFQPLTVSRTVSTESKKSITPKEETLSEESDSEEESVGDPVDGAPNGKRSEAISSPSNLIHNWVGRDTEQRKETKPQNGPLSREKQKLVNTIQQQQKVPVAPMTVDSNDHAELPDETNGDTTTSKRCDDAMTTPADKTDSAVGIIDSVSNPDPMGSPYDDLFSQRPPEAISSRQNLEENGAEVDSPDTQPPKHDVDTLTLEGADMPPPRLPTQSTDSAPETPIPAIASSSQKSIPGPVPNAFDRMRPKRTPLQTAEITVGDVTMTTTIGNSPPYKKRRVCKPDNSQRVASYGASPSLAQGLRKKFAAPGSQMEVDSSALSLPRSREEEDEPPGEQSEEEPRSDDDVPLPGPAARRTAHSKVDTSTRKPPTSDALDDLAPASIDDDEWDGDYIDEAEKKIKEDERVALLIQEAEEAAARPTEDNLKRATNVFKNGANRKGSTLRLARFVQTDVEKIKRLQQLMSPSIAVSTAEATDNAIVKDELDGEEAESRLSLTVTKSDFAKMRIIGQFNLGFVLAMRPGEGPDDEDDLFIIDQHAADEKYNYERLQRTVTLQSQRLFHAKPLELTAVEEEIVISHSDILKANGFEIETTSTILDSDEHVPTGRRCRLITRPLSKETVFDDSDLEELLHMLSEYPPGSNEIPRPRKVQRMLAMRACRSSIMVGKTLTLAQMSKVVKHMGEMEKPWNCPHGRPTMRHLAGLSAWNGWQEGDFVDEDEKDAASNAQQGRQTDWKAWLESR